MVWRQLGRRSKTAIGDLSWQPAPGYVLLLEHGKHFGAGHKQEFVTAVEVLDGVGGILAGQGKPFWAIVSGPDGWDAGLRCCSA